MVEVKVVKPMWRTKSKCTLLMWEMPALNAQRINYFLCVSESDLIPGLGTFIACLVLQLEIGILCGVGLNIMFILYHAARPKISVEKLTVIVHLSSSFKQLLLILNIAQKILWISSMSMQQRVLIIYETFSWINQISGEIWTKQEIPVEVAGILFESTRNLVNLPNFSFVCVFTKLLFPWMLRNIAQNSAGTEFHEYWPMVCRLIAESSTWCWLPIAAWYSHPWTTSATWLPSTANAQEASRRPWWSTAPTSTAQTSRLPW